MSGQHLDSYFCVECGGRNEVVIDRRQGHTETERESPCCKYCGREMPPQDDGRTRRVSAESFRPPRPSAAQLGHP